MAVRPDGRQSGDKKTKSKLIKEQRLKHKSHNAVNQGSIISNEITSKKIQQ
jgi:hypothetical protein